MSMLVNSAIHDHLSANRYRVAIAFNTRKPMYLKAWVRIQLLAALKKASLKIQLITYTQGVCKLNSKCQEQLDKAEDLAEILAVLGNLLVFSRRKSDQVDVYFRMREQESHVVCPVLASPDEGCASIHAPQVHVQLRML